MRRPRAANRLQDFPEYDCDPYKEFLCQELGNCGDDEVEEPWDDDVPNDPRPRLWRAAARTSWPSNWLTGMGSAVWGVGRWAVRAATTGPAAAP